MPDQTEANVNLGNALMKKGLIDQAIQQYQHALRLNPKQKEIYINLGRAFIQKQKFDPAIDLFYQALTIDTNYAEVRIDLANTLVRKGRLDEALYQYEVVISKKEYATIAARNRDVVLAKISREQQVRLLFNTAVRFAAEKQYDLAIDLLKRILVITPNDPLFYYNISCLFSIQDKKEQAIHWLRQAVEFGYDNWEKLKTDPDMKNIKDEPYFHELITIPE
jgi:tetratricopeptide (TPR) repeat protein